MAYGSILLKHMRYKGLRLSALPLQRPLADRDLQGTAESWPSWFLTATMMAARKGSPCAEPFPRPNLVGPSTCTDRCGAQGAPSNVR